MGKAAYRGDETTGFQSPAQDHIEAVPDLAELLELRRPQRYAVRVKGDGLRKRGIHSGDILVVTTDAPPLTGKVCVAFVHGDVVLAVLTENDGAWWLEPSNLPAQPVADDTEVWAMIAALVRTDDRTTAYALAVVAGEIIAGPHVRTPVSATSTT